MSRCYPELLPQFSSFLITGWCCLLGRCRAAILNFFLSFLLSLFVFALFAGCLWLGLRLGLFLLSTRWTKILFLILLWLLLFLQCCSRSLFCCMCDLLNLFLSIYGLGNLSSLVGHIIALLI